MDDVNLVFKHKDVLERLGDREPTTELEAQAVLEDIRASKGYLDEETLQDLSRMRDSSRQYIQRIVDSFQETAAAYTKSIAEQLYSSKYRFLYELIQNADDSMYDEACESGTKPSLTFNITPTCFVIETNEDGFTRANVKAICATGKSSKKASRIDEHIGEKGFGFKSVFAVAKKVHIQSGVWSFCFEHSRGQDGLGMVTPLNASPLPLAENIRTRITLSLADNGHAAYQKLVNAIEDLPNTVIFFLQKLENLIIRIEKSDGRRIETTVIQKTLEPTLRMVRLSREKQCFEGFGNDIPSLSERSDYHVVTHTIENMPEDERRTSRRTAFVQLAFPVDATTQKPKLSPLGQHVFAYLPLQRLSQLNFLIQSDFIASASRESVVDCAWNDAIGNGVAQAFAKAVAEFAKKDHPLRYLWLEFVPNTPMERFWEPLYPRIRELLRDMPILQTWQGRLFKRPWQLKVLVPITLHHGAPIFDDLPNEQYLAPEYGKIDVLKEFGVQTIGWTDLLERLQADMIKFPSKMRSLPPDDEWHASCAALLLQPFETPKCEWIKERLVRMAIIPLLSGLWTSVPIGIGEASTIFFPSTDGVPIPEDLPLRLVEPRAASVLKRSALFRKLGVHDCIKQRVIAHIQFLHITQTEGASHSCVPASHFKYLFHFDTSPELLRNWLLVPTEAGCLRQASKQLYFLSDEEYHTQRLLADGCETKQNGPAAFVRRELVEFESPNARCQNLLWKEWLRKVTGARYFPPLVEDPSASQLSPVMLDVLKQSCEKLVGLLQAHWNSEYESTISKQPWISSKLAECRVSCESNVTTRLNSTYLPFTEIKMKAKELGVEKDFPFLKLPVTLDKTNYRNWRFLEDLGVGHEVDLSFYQLVLKNMRFSDSVKVQNVARIYGCMANTVRLGGLENLRDFFEKNMAVYCPREGRNGIWKEQNECVWQAPSFLTIVEPLEIHYGSEPNLATFFSAFLGVRNAVIGDALNELETTRDEINNLTDAKVLEIYRYLDATAQSDADWELIRRKFNEQGLVFAGRKWCAPSSCLWASPFSISGFEVIGSLYSDLERFFVKQLRVKTASTSMLVIQLTRLAKKQQPPIERMREILIEIGTMIARGGVDEKLPKALEDLRKVKFLPINVLGNIPALAGIEDDFAIPDHPRFGGAFQGHSLLLDLSLDESHILDSLFRHLRLVDRYLSAAVKEISVVGEGALESRALSQELRAKAYALYCCAAKFKSTKALRDDTNLFQQFSTLQLYTAGSISTDLVLNLKSGQVTVKSDRVYLHSEIRDGQLKLYVPNDPVEQKGCYRSQLPTLLCKILGIASLEAAFPISLILSSDIEMLDSILQEQDIFPVPWITKPQRADAAPRIEQGGILGTPGSPIGNPSPPAWRIANGIPRIEQGGILGTAGSSTGNLTPHSWQTANDIRASETTKRYSDLLEQIITRANGSNHSNEIGAWDLSEIRNALPGNGVHARIFDRDGTFGERDRDQMAHDRKIGAAGELYVFETLSSLNLQGFGRKNWQSTIRDETQVHPQYQDLEQWTGRETADFVYIDPDGVFTQYLEATCFGGFPVLQCGGNAGLFQPIEYFIEVKTTTLACDTRFFMSKGQYKRMKDLQTSQTERPAQIYLIIRVFNLTAPEIDKRIYVDPWRFRGSLLTFEAQTWTVTPTDNA